MASSRALDLVLYGASGFVGKQAVAYLAEAAKTQPFRWAIAGRSEVKLRAVLRDVTEKGLDVNGVGVIVADAQDDAALLAMAAQARVVATTAGPYALFGSKLLAACVSQGAHYVDITGETPWVRQMIDLHHEAAGKKRLKIVPGCGFDSVPSDLGVALLAAEMQARFGEPLARAKSAFRIAGGGLNGGTAGSLMNVLDAGQGHLVDDLFLLNPEGSRPASHQGHEDPIAPLHDADFSAWIGPFVMGPINSRLVRRSAALRGESDLKYLEYMRFGKGFGAAVMATAFSSGALTGQALLKLAPVRKLAQGFMPKAGEGPSEAAMARGYFACEVVGESASGKKLRSKVSDQGDAGNRATTKMMCECALAVVHDEAELPKSFGVITPSIAFGPGQGDVLATRLRAAGMVAEVMA